MTAQPEHLAQPVDRIIDEDTFARDIPRRRDRQFVAALLGALGRAGGEISEGVLLEAAQQAWKPPFRMSREDARGQLLEKARATLNLSNVTQAIAAFYGLEANFTPTDAVKLHVAHIKGLKYKKTWVDPETGLTKEITVREKPSYEALRDFLKLTMPKEAKQINIDQRSLTFRQNIPYTPPEIDAIPIGEGK